jgi:LuxR family maltose regulon positive regulatory protein
MDKSAEDKFTGFEQFLITKFFLPPLPKSVVPRWHLIKQLNDRLYSDSRLTLVAAPAGYGKTTLVTNWLFSTERRYTWLTLESDDNDLVRFLSYFLAALQKIDKSIGSEIQNLIRDPFPSSVESLLNTIINDLSIQLKPIIFVLEDYHLINSEPIHKVVQYVMDHQPPSMHLVIITRVLPTLSLVRLRSYNKLTELKVEDMGFNYDEAMDFLINTEKLKLNNQQIEKIHNVTEGWITGLQLASESIRDLDEDNIEEGIQKFGVGNFQTMEYFNDQVYENLPPSIKEFLCQTSGFDRFSPELYDKIMDRDDSILFLEIITNENLFIFNIDRANKWYRYHPLFALFLQTVVDTKQWTDIKQKAVKWFEQNDMVADALNCISGGHNTAEIVRLIESGINDVFRTGKLDMLQTWLNQIPQNILPARPTLNPYINWMMFFSGKFEELISSLQINNSSTKSELIEFSLDNVQMLKAWVSVVNNKNKSLQFVRQSQKNIDKLDPFNRIGTLIALSYAERQAGELIASFNTLQKAFSNNDYPPHPFAEFSLLSEYLAVQNEKGQRMAALDTCQKFILRYKTTKDGDSPPCVDLAYLSLGRLYYESNKLNKAEKYTIRGLNYCKGFSAGTVLGWRGIVTLSLIYEARGEIDMALKTIHEARLEAKGINFFYAIEMAAATESEFLIRCGNIKPVLNWAKERGFTPNDRLKPGYEIQYLTYARLLLAQDMAKDAHGILFKLEQKMRGSEAYGTLIKVCILQSITEAKLNHKEEALGCLKEALHMAASEQYQRVFLNEGKKILDLLAQLTKIAPAFVNILLNNIKLEDVRRISTDAQQTAITSIPSANHRSGNLTEALSPREQEVLKLITEGLTNKAIGEKLFICVGTVKWHINRIFSKLAVRSRTQAIARARQLDILEKGAVLFEESQA